MNSLPISRAREILRYEPDTGKFFWIKTRGSVRAGSEAGWLHSCGYRVITIGGLNIRAHRLAWAMFYDEWPDEFIDHRNGIRDDNSINNLRKATNQQNQYNRSFVLPHKKEPKGVYFNKTDGTYIAQIRLNNKAVYLGRYDTPAEAHAVYVAEATKHFGEFFNQGERNAEHAE